MNRDAEAARAALVSTNQAGPRILVAEDNLVNQRVIRKMLIHLGCEVELCGDGKRTLERLDAERFDVLLLDCQMPGMDGFEVVRRIRGRPELADMPVIALTAAATVQDRKACQQAGMNDFLAKPVTLATLAGALAKWTGQES